MKVITMGYKNVEKRILKNLEAGGISHRAKATGGLWLGPLMGLSAMATILREDNSYSEICLLVGLTGVGLIISTACLFVQLIIDKSPSRDFQIIYFLPASITSMLYLLGANKGLLTSVFWGLGTGSLGTWGVLQLMSYFSRCFTLGEAVTVTHGIILFLLSAGSNLPLRYHLPPLHDDDIATTILQVGIIFIGVCCILPGLFPKIRQKNLFYMTTFGLLILGLVPVLHILLDRSPLVWMISYIFGSLSRVLIIVYWTVCLILGAGLLSYQIQSDSQASTVRRKGFHLLAVLVYIPGLLWEPTLLYLASGVIMGVFMMMELMRLLKLPPLGDILQSGFSVFADKKDHLISLTPLYLLSGLSFPLWMPTSNLEILPLLSGVLTIGIGDSAASIVGTKWGKTKWPGSNKSVEGTVACILSQLTFVCGLAILGFIPNYFILIRSTLSIIAVSFIEARTDQVDNLPLPIILYTCLVI
ncbi:dolichol kinase isoform X1 [Diachasma alloeum]|uniref:dolichol kinase isoform X1 n=2 Tax=Diachasma alloeum TaxID=454923 RepID=UPI0007382414|nr:dolichol kinase isoform X1 [Diachasma alloeum]